MRILEQAPDRLVLELRPVALMVLCAGLFLLFFVLGFGMRLAARADIFVISCELRDGTSKVSEARVSVSRRRRWRPSTT